MGEGGIGVGVDFGGGGLLVIDLFLDVGDGGLGFVDSGLAVIDGGFEGGEILRSVALGAGFFDGGLGAKLIDVGGGDLEIGGAAGEVEELILGLGQLNAGGSEFGGAELGLEGGFEGGVGESRSAEGFV